MRWLELAVEADPEAVEAVSEILGRVATGGTTVEPAFDLVDEGLGARIDPGRPAVVRGYVPIGDGPGGPAAAEDAAARVADALGHLQAFGLRQIGELRTRTVQAGLGGRLEGVLPGDADRASARDPARRGASTPRDPTTSCLLWTPGWPSGPDCIRRPGCVLPRSSGSPIEGRIAGARVLDVGCGSGILSIAALKLGGATVLGVDTDPIAVEATVANAARNDLDRRLEARQGSLPTGEAPFDVVLANLVAGVLIPLASSLHAELVPGGTLVASGIFIDREAEVTAAFEAAGLRVTERTADGDWVAIELRGP